MFKDPANIFVALVVVGWVFFMVATKIHSDRLEREEKAKQEEKAKKAD